MKVLLFVKFYAILKKEVVGIRKNNPKYNKWLKRRLKRLERRRCLRKKKNGISVSAYNTAVRSIKKPTAKRDIEEVVAQAPAVFSLINNSEEVGSFFDGIKKYIMSSMKKKVSIFFDLSRVETVTIDAIMYLLAIIKNLQKHGVTKHYYHGNMPSCKEAHAIFQESGFLNFVNSSVATINTNTNKIAIRTGRHNDASVLRDICDFIIEKAKGSKITTKSVYVILAEMMYNTYEHAYTDMRHIIDNWYIFAEYVKDSIKITFLDTGLGIPKTIRRNFGERLLQVSEGKLVQSALNGEFRSKTKLKYRNNGLPTIKKQVEDSRINNLHIISNRASCIVNKTDDGVSLISKELKTPIMGTLYYWEIPVIANMEVVYD